MDILLCCILCHTHDGSIDTGYANICPPGGKGGTQIRGKWVVRVRSHFCQLAALNPATQWNTLDPSLVASTFLGSRAEGTMTQFCQLCREVDHNWEDCALRGVRETPRRPPTQPPPPQELQVGRRSQLSSRIRPETLDRICVSWNKGRCVYPGTCTFRHRCATCRQPGHVARDCADTPEDSEYRQPRQQTRGPSQDIPQSQNQPGGRGDVVERVKEAGGRESQPLA